MENLVELFEGDPTDWITSLKSYQRTIVQELLSTCESPDEAASKWLTATPQNTAPFGTSPNSQNVYMEKLKQELVKFLCGDSQYETDRQKLLAEVKPLHSYAVGVISSAISITLGTNAIFLAPVIALLLMTVGRVSLNAFCETCKQTPQE